MLTDCYGYRMPTASVTVLYLIVVVNIYNLIIVELLLDPVIREFSNGFEKDLLTTASQNIVPTLSFQTIALIFAIILSTRHRETRIFFAMKYITFAIIFVTLIYDMMIAVMVAAYAHAFYNNTISDKYWKNGTNEKKLKEPGISYLGIIVISTAYFVFKIYAAAKITQFGKKNRIGVVDVSTNSDDIEMNATHSLTLSPAAPPSYDECIIESISPPSYTSEAQK